MASVTRSEGSPSEAAFMDEIINVYHPDYKNDTPSQKRKNVERALRGNFQMSQVLEEAIFCRSLEIRDVPLVNVDIPGMDFDDGSDLKSCTLSFKKNGGGIHALTGNIQSLKNKTGDIRIILWNDMNKVIEYYFIPNNDIKNLMHKTGIRFSASRYTGIIEKFVQYRLDTFDDLVRI